MRGDTYAPYAPRLATTLYQRFAFNKRTMQMLSQSNKHIIVTFWPLSTVVVIIVTFVAIFISRFN